ncbi:hypothetical protein CBL_20679, partial [Carabus blaptoides fortunei]
MPSYTIKCCIAGCKAVDVHQHRFPNPATHLDRFNTWLVILGSQDLLAMDPAKVYNNRRICSAHFLPKYFSLGNPKLHRNAVPTLDTSERIILPASPSCASTSGGQVSSERTHRETTPEKTTECHGDILRSASVTRHTSLTPKAKVLYKTALHWKKVAFQRKRRHQSFKARLAHAEKFAESHDVDKMSVMTSTAQLFFKLQFRETSKAKKLRRFTIDEKTMSLSLLKQSAKTYDLLQKMFTLPSRRTLNKFLSKITLGAGINKRLFAVLKTNVRKMNPLHRTCSLMFDEISLSPQLQYNERLDQIDGFVDDGVNRTQDFADHALVFMVRGVVKNWKQAVAFTFCESTTKSTLLKNLIKQTIAELQATGLNVISTVCDQASANCSAINQLIAETRAEYIRRGDDFKQKSNWFEVNGIKIIALYDVPHLLKGLRNHFAKKNIVCTIQGDVVTDICIDAKQTVQVVLFLDQLFDSLNSNSRNGTGGKPLTGALTANSEHWQFWKIACKVLNGMEFVDRKKSYPPSLKNFPSTIRGIQEIFRIARKVGAKYLCLRNFNQDPLENFFGMIRSHGLRNISPSCTAFTAALKTLTINNFMAKHSMGANCEEDVTEGAISTLRELLTNNSATDEESIEENYENPGLVNISEDNIEISNYCSGFVIKTLKKITKKCAVCKSELESLQKGPQHAVISGREYTTDVDRLVYP